jgi:hypothetical protein
VPDGYVPERQRQAFAYVYAIPSHEGRPDFTVYPFETIIQLMS